MDFTGHDCKDISKGRNVKDGGKQLVMTILATSYPPEVRGHQEPVQSKPFTRGRYAELYVFPWHGRPALSTYTCHGLEDHHS